MKALTGIDPRPICLARRCSVAIFSAKRRPCGRRRASSRRVLEHAVEGRGAVAAHEDRRVRPLGRLGNDQILSKLTNSPWYSASSFVQISFIASDLLAQQAAARLEGGAVVLHLLGVPAAADAEEEAAAREMIEAGDLLGERDRVALDHQADAGAEPQLRRDRRRHGERDERIVGVPVLLGQVGRRRATGCGGWPGCGCARGSTATRSRAPRPRAPARRDGSRSAWRT